MWLGGGGGGGGWDPHIYMLTGLCCREGYYRMLLFVKQFSLDRV